MLLGVSILPITAQTTQQQFGKNRIQYHDFKWSYYKSDHFVTYFYLGGQDIGKYVIQQAEADLNMVEEKVEYRASNKIEVLVYNDISDLRQSNLGIGQEKFNTGGLTQIVGNKIFLYYNGNHLDLRRQIQEGIAQVLINDMMYGGNLQEVVQNSVLLSLPAWFMEGIVSYMAEEWSFEKDNKLKDGILSGKYAKVNKLNGSDARLVGHSLAKYIVDKYGKSALPSVLYLTRLNRNLESGFTFVLGGSVNQIIDDWYNFYYNKYKNSTEGRNLPDESAQVPVKIKKHKRYNHISMSSDTNFIAFKQDDIGRYKIKLFNRSTGKTNVIMKGGYKTITQQIDRNYPILEWHPTENKLAILYEKRDEIKLLFYDLDPEKSKKERKEEIYDITKFQRITDFKFIDKETIVLSAISRGVSDIYTYHIPSSRVEKLTNDYYDDMDPAYVELDEGRKGIVFVSNRDNDTLNSVKLDTTLPTNRFDVFYYDYVTRSKNLIRLSNTPFIDEQSPQQYDDKHISYLSNINGIQNRVATYLKTVFSHNDYYFYYPDTTIISQSSNLDTIIAFDTIPDSTNIVPVYKDVAVSFPVTNYATSIIEEEVHHEKDIILQHIYNEGRSQFYTVKLPEDINEFNIPSLTPTPYFLSVREEYKKSSESQKKNTGSINGGTEIPSDLIEKPTEEDLYEVRDTILPTDFQSDFTYPNNNPVIEFVTNEDGTVSPTPTADNDSLSNDEFYDPVFKSTRVLPYQLRFSSTYVVAQLDNSIIFGRYQNFNGGGPIFQTPSLNPLIQIGINDILEDYKFVGGFRIATNLSGAEYFGTFENLKGRIDRKMLFYRSTTKNTDVFGFGYKLKSNYFQYSLSYPIDILRSVRGHIGLRNDKTIILANDIPSIETPNINENWTFAKLEYVLDNTIDPFINIHDGIKYKVYTEFHRQLGVKNSHFAVVGTDIRWYQKIDRQIIWANRFSAATSFGTRKMIYYLGGVDNWIWPKYDERNQIDFTQNYAFQMLATNMRGFIQNARNGHNNAVINSEIRAPIFTYFFNKPIKSEFIRNFQVVLFGDIGSAWNGVSPFAQDNPFNSDVVGGPPAPITIVVDYFQNPIIGGFGTGVRSTVLGYFLRADLAWGVDNGKIQKPVFYLSMTLDF